MVCCILASGLQGGSDQDRGGEVVGLNPSIRIYRYSKGQFFDCPL